MQVGRRVLLLTIFCTLKVLNGRQVSCRHRAWRLFSSQKRIGVDPSFYKEQRRQSKINISMASKKKLAETGNGDGDLNEETLGKESVTKKAKLSSSSSSPKKDQGNRAEGKFAMKDYMPKKYPIEQYPSAPEGHVKIVSWNVNGLNAAYDKGFVPYVIAENPDILVLQETKLQQN